MTSLKKFSNNLGACMPPSLAEQQVVLPQLQYDTTETASQPERLNECYNRVSTDSQFDTPQQKSSDRESRNRAEKERRGQLNSLITELTSLLPAVCHSQRRIDKTGVLRLAANDLRNDHVFGDSIKCAHQDPSPEWILRILDVVHAFLIVITCRGVVVNVSPNVLDYLGHCRIDLLDQNIYNYINSEDEVLLRKNIYPPELHASYIGSKANVYGLNREFHIRFKRAGSKTDPPRYEKCHISGSLRLSDRASTEGVQEEQVIRRQRVRRDRTFSSSGSDVVFIGLVRLVPSTLTVHIPPPGASTEYWTRHLLDGRIVQCDQYISLVAGYMTEEVMGASAFTFMHKDDVRWVVCVLRQMYDESKEFGESCYRLISRTGQFIYLRTRGFLEIDKATKQVQSFVCVNSIVTEEEGRRLVDEMKRKYSVIVNMDRRQIESDRKSPEDEIAVEHPQRLESVIRHLVMPPSRDSVPEPFNIIPPGPEDISIAIKNSIPVILQTGVCFDSSHSVRRKRTIKELDCDDENDNIKRHSANVTEFPV